MQLLSIKISRPQFMAVKNAIPWQTDNRVSISVDKHIGDKDVEKLVKTSYITRKESKFTKLTSTDLSGIKLDEELSRLTSLYNLNTIDDFKPDVSCVIRYTQCGSYTVDDIIYELQASAVFECEDPNKCDENLHKEYIGKLKDFSEHIDLSEFNEWRLTVTASKITQDMVGKCTSWTLGRERIPASIFNLYQEYKKLPRKVLPDNAFIRLKLGGPSFNEQLYDTIYKRLAAENHTFTTTKRVYIERPLTPENKVIDIRETILADTQSVKNFRRSTITYSTKVLDVPCEVYYNAPINEFTPDAVSKNIYLQYIVNTVSNNWNIKLVSEISVRYDDSDKLAISVAKLKEISKGTLYPVNSLFSAKSIEVTWDSRDKLPTYDDFMYITNVMLGISQDVIMIRKLANVLGKHDDTLKDITNAPYGIDRVEYSRVFPPYDYMITEKTEGVHAVVWVHNSKVMIITDEVIELPTSETISGDYVIEGEIIYKGRDDVDPSKIKVIPSKIKDYLFLAFDVLMYNSELMTDEITQVRISKLDDAVDVIKSAIPAEVKEFITLPTPADIAEAMIPDDKYRADLKESFDKVWKRLYDYETDGIIIQQASKSYYNTKIYKWKPADKLSIDFLVKECPSSMLGKFPYEQKAGKRLFWLFSGISRDKFNELHKRLPPAYMDLFPSYVELSGKQDTRRDGRQYDRRPERQQGRPERQQGRPERPHGNQRDGQHGRQHDRHAGRRDQKGNVKGGRDIKIVNSNYFPIHFSPSDDPLAYLFWVSNDELKTFGTDYEDLDGRIGEFIYDGDSWRLLRIRYDREVNLAAGKYYGNNYGVAELTWEAIRNPLQYDDLHDFDASRGYFQEEKQSIYKAQTGYNSFVKTTLVNKYSRNNKWLIDMAGGRGADIGRYSEANVGHVTVVDVDRDALTELIARKIRYKKELMDLTTIHADLNEMNAAVGKIKTLQKNINLPEQADTVYCNFAIHYMIDTIDEFAKGINELVKKDGYFIYTCLDGSKVFNLLKENGVKQGESWILEENTAIKYQIQRKYKSDEFTDKGQRIAVKLPFSREELYEEPLANMDYINKSFTKMGFSVEQLGGFASQDFAKQFGIPLPRITKDLTNNDNTWVGLYSYCILKK